MIFSEHLASVDPGNVGIKAARPGMPAQVFPNAWAIPSQDTLAQWSAFQDDGQFLVSLNGGPQVALGEMAFQVNKIQHARTGYIRYDAPTWPTLIAGALAQLYERGGDLDLFFAMPVDGWRQSQSVAERLLGDWRIEIVDGPKPRTLRFNIRNAIPVPESFGILMTQSLNHDGSRWTNFDSEGKVAIIDIGGYTTTIAEYSNLRPGAVMGAVEHGLLNVRERLNTAIKREFRRGDLDSQTLDQVIKSKRYIHAGKPEDVGPFVEDALWPLVEGTLDQWEGPLARAVDHGAVIFGGGGAPEIAPRLLQDIEHGNIVVADRDTAHLWNADGTLRYAMNLRNYGG